MEGIISSSDATMSSMVGEDAWPGHVNGSGELNDLVKALEATQLTGQAATNLTTASGAALKVESLDKTLKHITFKETDIRLYKRIQTTKAYNTVEEYNQLSSYGSDGGGFTLEGELPNEEDSTYVRRAELVKYLGVTKSVSHPMTLVNSAHGAAVQREVQNGTMYILRKLNLALTRADETIIPEEFTGLYGHHAKNDAFSTHYDYLNSEVVVDCRGSALTETFIETGLEGIIENFGLGTEMFLPPSVLSRFATTMYSRKQFQSGDAQNSDAVAGKRIKVFESQYGDIQMTWDTFLSKERFRISGSGADNARCPSAPVADGSAPVTPVAATVTNSKWASSDAGTYFYAVAAINRFGKSPLTILNSGAIATIVANGAVDLKFTAGAGANSTNGYIIYRSNKGAASAAVAKYYPLFRINTSQLATGHYGASALSVRDLNLYMPDTDQAFAIQNDDEVLTFRQLAPLMKMDLAVISPAYRFMVLLYGTPILFAPKKMVRFINIGQN